eukprot:16451995-Heterocapsa_arctica.AAC.1
MRPATPGVADQLRLTRGRSGRRFHQKRRSLDNKSASSDSAPTGLSALQRLAGLTLTATERLTTATTARTPSMKS